MRILGIDPGPTESAFVVWDGRRVEVFAKYDNESLLMRLEEEAAILDRGHPDAISKVVIEKIASFGMPVGAEVFETVFWSGVFAQAFDLARTDRITRIAVKSHLCHSAKAKDGNIRQALIDRFGGVNAIGKKATPGPLYGVSGDVWSALAVAVTWWDQNAAKIAA